jgi:hypothetical protein
MNERHKLLDEFGVALLAAERALVELKLGVSASVPLVEDDVALHFQHCGECGLFIACFSTGTFTKMSSWSVAHRILAAKALPTLYRAMLERFLLENLTGKRNES